MKLTYKDFVTGKPKWTRGRFLHWTDKTGPLGVKYAAIERERSMLFIPVYCLTPEARRGIEYELRCRALPERLIAECKLQRPSVPRKHLFGIDRKGRGWFLVATADRCVTREALKEMYQERNAEGLESSKLIRVYCACSLIGGPGLEIIQVDCDGLEREGGAE